MPTPQNGQTHSNNLSAVAKNLKGLITIFPPDHQNPYLPYTRRDLLLSCEERTACRFVNSKYCEKKKKKVKGYIICFQQSLADVRLRGSNLAINQVIDMKRQPPKWIFELHPRRCTIYRKTNHSKTLSNHFGTELILFFPMFSFDPPENRKR